MAIAGTRQCFLFDIDGTLADGTHRVHHIAELPKNWDAYFAGCKDDAPIGHMITVARCLGDTAPIVYVTGRRESCRADTLEWLRRHYLLPPLGAMPFLPHLYMRPDGDHRDDDILKIDLLAKVRADGWEPIMVFDDRTRVVNAWRAAGVPCCQCAPGDF